jgi:protein arginine N-methyltransferase 1
VLGTTDEGYFANYGNFDIPKEMLADKIRVSKYQEAIENVVKGKIVLDIGCGTGILSAFAVNAGAKEVTAIDKADVVEKYLTKKLNESQVLDKVNFIVSRWKR